jgi:DNA-binding transcriptional LysR family regulator
MLDRLTSMAVFVRVADRGSFAAAADGLGITPGMVGKHVRYLEDRIGALLLNRTTRNQSLTDIGRTFLERARTILSEVDSAESLADEAQTEPKGTLRITAPVAFGSEILSPALVEYSQRHTLLSIDLSLSDGIVDLVEEGLDAALRVGAMGDSTLMSRALAPYRFMLCAAPSYVERRGAPADPSDLARHDCLVFAHWRGGDIWKFQKSDGDQREIRVQSRIRMNTYAALRAAALAGAGIILQSEAALAAAIAEKRLIPLLPDWESPSHPMQLVWLPDRRPTRKLRSFIDFVVERFTPNRAISSA